MSTAEELKILGNQAFQEGKYDLAIEKYTEAIQADPTNSIYYNNRALAYFSQKNWIKSLGDASTAVKLDPKNVKAHYRLVKSLINLNKIFEARQCLSYAFKVISTTNKDLLQLEQELIELTGMPIRPKPTDFEILNELGEGNFSSVIHVALKKNKEKEFAIKVIQRDTIERMKKRHPNIHNEILMEKRILNKLRHPGIVKLYNTFQDYNALYFLMEYLGGIDLWSFLHDMDSKKKKSEDLDPIYFNENDKAYRDKLRSGYQLGLYSSFLRYFVAQILSILEYMHQKGIVHRDLKPENIILTPTGQLKLIDFGTCKDLIETDLNGQEFVGTPEYMCPEIITSSKKKHNIRTEADLWSLGVIIYQFLFGSTPFVSNSPFLVFLKVKRNLIYYPEDLSEEILGLLNILLQTDKTKRLFDTTGVEYFYTEEEKKISDGIIQEEKKESEMNESEVEFKAGDDDFDLNLSEEERHTREKLKEKEEKKKREQQLLKIPENSLPLDKLSYKKLREHPFFTDANRLKANRFLHYSHALGSKRSQEEIQEIENLILQDNKYKDINYHQNIFNPEEFVRIPSLHDLALRSTANTAYQVGLTISNNGGIRPKDLWIQKFKLYDYREKKESEEEEVLPQETLPEAYGNQTVPLLFPDDRHEVMRLLNSKNRLSNPSTYRLFFHSLISTHFHRIINYNHSYIGHTHLTQGNFDSNFFFLQFTNPSIEYNEEMKLGETKSEKKYRELISSFNKLRPKFVTVFGNFIQSYENYLATTSSSTPLSKEAWYKEAVKRFQSNSCRFSNTISLVYVCGENDFLSTYPLTSSSLSLYRKNFGSDYYIFWYGGLGLVVINSLLLNHLGEYIEDPSKIPEDLVDEVKKFELWLEQLIEQIKLCSTSIMICSYLPWYNSSVNEEDSIDANGKYT